MDGATATSCDYKGVAGEGTQATLLQGQLSTCIRVAAFHAYHT